MGSSSSSKFTFLDYALEVLKTASAPMTFREIWQAGLERGLDKKLKSEGKTPWQSLGARLFVDVKENSSSPFIKIGNRPARFFLAARASEISAKDLSASSEPTKPKAQQKTTYSERQLHPLVAYFVYANTAFGKGHQVISKTIFHEKSKKKAAAEWTHPDMVGFYLPIDDWDESLFRLSEVANSDALQLYSFELKREISRSTYRESFFQAVSNSSWAHEGYLVAASISEDEDVQSELSRLSSAFGIGVIQLDVGDIDSSTILFPARPKPTLDWETMNKLASQNEDFRTFLDDVVKTSRVKEVNKSKFDRILEDPQEYAASILQGPKAKS